MGEELKKDCIRIAHSIPFWITMSVSILLIVASFIVPPTGIIHPSVLTAAGELMGFAALWCAYVAIDRGVDASIKHNNTQIDIKNDENGKD